jgi:hypothetical protein
VAPVLALYVPGLQRRHVEPATLEYFPALQGVQTVPPGVGLSVPAAHSEQVVEAEAVLIELAGQGVQMGFPASEVVPGLHARHEEDPVPG